MLPPTQDPLRQETIQSAEAGSFMCALPRVQAANVTSPANGGATILVVEDDPGLRAMVGYLLRWQGYRVIEASHPVEAESFVRHFTDPIHLVLMDVTLPTINGYELARTFLTIRTIPAMLFVSGYEEDHLALDRTIGAKREFLLKPFEPYVLIGKVHALLNAT